MRRCSTSLTIREMQIKTTRYHLKTIRIVIIKKSTNNKCWRPSRWWRSKMWRSPFSPQIHQKYIYMWKNSYKTPTEHRQKTSDFTKGKKLPTYQSRAKEKNRQKNREGTCTTGREVWRRKSFHTPGNPFTGGDREWRGGSFGATEESAATGVQRAKRRDSYTEDWCWRALNSPRGLSAHLLARTGGSCVQRLQLIQRTHPRERTGVGCVKTAWRGLVCHSYLGGNPEKVWNCLRVKRPLFWGAQGEGIQSTT